MNNKFSGKLWAHIDGKSVQIDRDLKLSGLGEGLFETFIVKVREKSNLHVLGWSRHLERLIRDISEFKLHDIHIPQILTALENALKDEHIGDYKVRIIVQKDRWWLTIEEWRPRFDLLSGVALRTFLGARALPKQKSLMSTDISYSASVYANETGADEGLLVNQAGNILEGSWSNFFWIDPDNTIVTPADGVLAGVTKSIVTEIISASLGVNLVHRELALDEVFAKGGGAFITQSTHGIVPVRSIDNLKTGRSGFDLCNKIAPRFLEFVEKIGS